jgi:hypothetical protein
MLRARLQEGHRTTAPRTAQCVRSALAPAAEHKCLGSKVEKSYKNASITSFSSGG